MKKALFSFGMFALLISPLLAEETQNTQSAPPSASQAVTPAAPAAKSDKAAMRKEKKASMKRPRHKGPKTQ